jgi:hypothetical protein
LMKRKDNIDEVVTSHLHKKCLGPWTLQESCWWHFGMNRVFCCLSTWTMGQQWMHAATAQHYGTWIKLSTGNILGYSTICASCILWQRNSWNNYGVNVFLMYHLDRLCICCTIWGPHGGEYEDGCLFGYSAV